MKLLVALAASTLLSACGVTTVSQTYDPSLIRQVGTGSNAVANIVPSIEREARTVGSLDNKKADHDAVLVLQGKLNQLTPTDIVLVANANRRSFTAFETALGRINEVASNLDSDQVDPAAHSNLSGGAKKFVAEWNGYLTGIAAETRRFRSALAGEEPYFNELQGVLRAAYETQNGSVAEFDRVRRKFITDLKAATARMQATVKSVASGTPTDRQFASFVDHNQQAQAIVEKVNQEYRHGWLAEEFKRG